MWKDFLKKAVAQSNLAPTVNHMCEATAVLQHWLASYITKTM